jgi:hypothetical protein
MSAATDASGGSSSEHASVPDRGVSTEKARELTRRHDKLCHTLRGG